MKDHVKKNNLNTRKQKIRDETPKTYIDSKKITNSDFSVKKEEC